MDAKAKRGAWIVTVALIGLMALGGLLDKQHNNGPCRLDSSQACTLGVK